MRTNIDIDDELMQQAMAATGAKSKKAAVEEALRQVVQLNQQGAAIRRMQGAVTWVGHDDDWFAPDPLDPEWNAELASVGKLPACGQHVGFESKLDSQEASELVSDHGNR